MILEALTDWMNASRGERETATQSCLDRIREQDPAIQAWAQVLPQPPTGDGPLSGIPFGAKDIIETRGLQTEYGSPIYKGRVGTEDAAIVRDLRARGAVLLGKTHTTAFAHRTPAPTRNPRNLNHTPGGSSSGSAAAVAAGMVPFALGTQTRGSVLRPASFCGVTGFKPGYGRLSLEGVLPFAKSLDTLGCFTHTPADMIRLWEAMGYSTGARGEREEIVFGVPEPELEVEPAMAEAFHSALAALRYAGVPITPIDIAPVLTSLDAAGVVVMYYEGARFHEERFKEYGSRLADIATLVVEGLKIPVAKYEQARTDIAEGRARLTQMYRSTPVILVPAATGPAPAGLGSTGDPRMNGAWTALGTPAISVPLPVSELPLGLQLTADRGQEDRLLRAAERVHQVLHAPR